MATTYVSCPCCGMTVPLHALNFDPDGNRIEAPVQYGTFVKVRHAGGHKGIHWDISAMPHHMLLGLSAQLETALAAVRRQLS